MPENREQHGAEQVVTPISLSNVDQTDRCTSAACMETDRKVFQRASLHSAREVAKVSVLGINADCTLSGEMEEEKSI